MKSLVEYWDEDDRFRDEGIWSEIDDAKAFFNREYTQKYPLPDEMDIGQYFIDCLDSLEYNTDDYDASIVECIDYSIIDILETDPGYGYYSVEVDAVYNIHVPDNVQYDKDKLLKDLNEISTPSHFDDSYYGSSVDDLETINIRWAKSFISDHDINLDLQVIFYTQY